MNHISSKQRQLQNRNATVHICGLICLANPLEWASETKRLSNLKIISEMESSGPNIDQSLERAGKASGDY